MPPLPKSRSVAPSRSPPAVRDDASPKRNDDAGAPAYDKPQLRASVPATISVAVCALANEERRLLRTLAADDDVTAAARAAKPLETDVAVVRRARASARASERGGVDGSAPLLCDARCGSAGGSSRYSSFDDSGRTSTAAIAFARTVRVEGAGAGGPPARTAERGAGAADARGGTGSRGARSAAGI